MSDSESDNESITSSVEEEASFTMSKTCDRSSAALPGVPHSPVIEASTHCQIERGDVKGSLQGTAMKQQIAPDNPAPAKSHIVHVDVIWDKEKRQFVTIPPAADAATNPDEEKCILLIRHIHSRDHRTPVEIRVEVKPQSLRRLMRNIFSGANAFAWGDRNDLDPKWFFWARPRLIKLKQFCEVSGREQMATEILAALEFCRSHYAQSLDSIDALKRERRVRFRDIWTIYAPNTLVTGTDKLGHFRVWSVEDGQKIEHGHKRGKYALEVRYVESDGQGSFGWATDYLWISPFSGARLLDQLAVQPLHLLGHRHSIREQLENRAAKQLGLPSPYTLKQYKGHGLITDERPDGTIELKKQHFRGRVMLDPVKTLEVNPEGLMPRVYQFTASDHEHHDCVVDEPDGKRFMLEEILLDCDNQQDEEDLQPKRNDIIPLSSADQEQSALPAVSQHDSRAAPHQQSNASHISGRLDSLQKLLLSGLVYGYDFKLGQWGAFSVTDVETFIWNDAAFDSLVMEDHLKHTLGTLVQAYGRRIDDSGFDDFIKHKGRGLIGLLFGKPGLGKTFTAEAIAEMAHLPLMTVSAGRLGSKPDEIEKNLRSTLDLAAHWRAVVLFDEADVFLAARVATSIERNAVVSVFLRELEYFPGIMLLTTNKKDLIDEAFHSRIHFYHEYPELDFPARMGIWKEFADRAQSQTDLAVNINNRGLEQLASNTYNGREIKNIMSMATTWALHQDRTPPRLDTDDILEISNTLQNWEAVSRHDRASSRQYNQDQHPNSSVFSSTSNRGGMTRSTLLAISIWLMMGTLMVGFVSGVLPQLLAHF